MSRKTFVLQEVERWKKSGLISPAQAAAIQLEYNDNEGDLLSKTPGVIFGSLGAIAVGLGIILLFAFNWDEMPKMVKLTAALAPIFLFHGVGILFRAREFPAWMIETSHLLGTMMFGASIMLVAQIYHIDEHWPNGFLAWGLGASLMFFTLQSKSHGIFSVILFSTYLIGEACDTNSLTGGLVLIFAPFIIFATYGIWAYLRRSVVMMVPTLIFFGVSVFCAISLISSSIASVTLDRYTPGTFSISALAFALPLFYYGCWYFVRNDETAQKIASTFKSFGHITFFAMLILLTFSPFLRSLFHGGLKPFFVMHELLWAEVLLWALLLLMGVVLPIIVGIIVFRRYSCPLSVRLNNWIPVATYALFIGFGVCLATGYLMDPDTSRNSPLFDLFSIAMSAILMYEFLAHIWNGCKERHLFAVILFTLALSGWMIVRFFTWFDSLIARGIAFLCIGIFLILVATVYSKLKPKKVTEV